MLQKLNDFQLDHGTSTGIAQILLALGKSQFVLLKGLGHAILGNFV